MCTPFLLLDRVLTEISLVSKTKLSKAYTMNKANNLLNSIFIFMLSDYQVCYNSIEFHRCKSLQSLIIMNTKDHFDRYNRDD